MPDDDPSGRPPTPQPAAVSSLSLAQALLAPLDAIFKAQLHAARSFLNLLLQLGYAQYDPNAPPEAQQGDGTPFMIDFFHEVELEGERRRQKISVPALALLPVAPLAVDEATFTFDFAVETQDRASQLQRSRVTRAEDAFQRPWFLVDQPMEIKGQLAPQRSDEPGRDSSRRTAIHVEVKVGQVPTPSGLEKLLTALGQVSTVEEVGAPQRSTDADPNSED